MEKEIKIITINGGSSSVKVQLYDMPSKKLLFKALVERIDLLQSIYNSENFLTNKKQNYVLDDLDYFKALKHIFDYINKNIVDVKEIVAAAHRFVQGGEFFSESIIISDEHTDKFKKLENLAPLHNPINTQFYQASKKLLVNAVHCAVFDTSFHLTMKPEDYIFPIPYRFYQKYKIRRYGAHGTSYRFILKRMQEILNKEKINLIVCHIGSGASLCAIENSKSLITSMGLTPLGGIMMGNRSGDLDPSVLEFMSKYENIALSDLINILNKESGLKGVSGLTNANDFREITKEMFVNKNERAKLALTMFAQKIVNKIGEYYFRLNGNVDGIILTGGIGENSLEFRYYVFERIANIIKLEIDEKKLKEVVDHFLFVNKDNHFPVMGILRTNEEEIMASDAYKLLKNIK